MTTLSEKARTMPASPMRKLVPYAEEAKKRGVKVYHLNIGQPDIETPREALDAIAAMREPIIYYTRQGELQARIGRILQRLRHPSHHLRGCFGHHRRIGSYSLRFHGVPRPGRRGAHPRTVLCQL